MLSSWKLRSGEKEGREGEGILTSLKISFFKSRVKKFVFAVIRQSSSGCPETQNAK